MRYSVCAFKPIKTVAGLQNEPQMPVDCGTSTRAERIAAEMTATGQYSEIYIGYNHPDSACYWNPAVGFEPVGKDWVQHFRDAEYA